MQNDTSAQKLPTPPNDQALCLSPADVRKTLSRINPRKAAGPDNIPGRVLKDCAEQLTDVLTDIFNTSLSQAVIPTCLKSTTIIPVPKKSPVFTVWYGNCCAADRKTLQRTVNTAAKIIGAPLPSILDIFLTQCSSKAKSIVEDPTHPSHSLFQLLPSGRRYRSIRAAPPDCSTAFSPRLWEPWTHITQPLSETPNNPPPPPPPTLTHLRKKLLNFYLCAIQVSGPAQATCSNTLSSACTRHFHTPLCVHNPTKDWL